MTKTIKVLQALRDELAAKLNASKGGNTSGITEDHRFVMADQMYALDQAISMLLLCVEGV